jgi:hypothetical protein
LAREPAADFRGEVTFNYIADDGFGQATATVTVNPVNDAPVAAAQSLTTNEDTAKAITLAGTDVDGNAQAPEGQRKGRPKPPPMWLNG